MAIFEVKYELGTGYENKVELDIRLENKPSGEDLTTLVTLVETLDDFAKKNVDFKLRPVIKEGK